jgi:hypothetical protein
VRIADGDGFDATSWGGLSVEERGGSTAAVELGLSLDGLVGSVVGGGEIFLDETACGG